MLGLKRLVFPALNPGGIYKEAHGNSSFKSVKLTKKGNLGWTYSGYHDEVSHGLCFRSSLKLVCSLTCELSQTFSSASGMMHLISNSITTLCVSFFQTWDRTTVCQGTSNAVHLPVDPTTLRLKAKV